MEMTAARFRTKDIAYIALFTALIAVGAWISIPTPSRIDFTLQTLGIFLAMGVLGGKRGTLAVTAYLLLGAVGAPVFSGFSGGLSTLVSPSGGYLLGFFFTALFLWAVEKVTADKLWKLGAGMVVGAVIYYAFGTAWFMVVYPMGGESVTLWTALTWCVFPYVIFDLIKIALALTLTSQLRRHVK